MALSWSDLKTIYLRLPNWVGDVVLATPALAALRRAAPQAEITRPGRGVAFKVLESEALHDRALALKKRGGPLWPFLEGKRVRQEIGGAPDLAILFPNSISSALVARSTGAPRCTGYRLNGRGHLLHEGPWLEQTGILRPIPMVDYYLDLLASLGVDTAGIPRCPVLTQTPAAQEWAEGFLTRLGVQARRLWAINLGGSWETKQWIPAHAGRLVKLLEREGIQPLLLRGPDEGPLADAVCAAAGKRVPGADEVVGLKELCAVIARTELLITTDSGPRHFGIAAGVPVVVLIGSTHPGYTAVDYPDLHLLSERVPCWPCHLKVCPLDFHCMKLLTPERVLAAGHAALAARAAREGVAHE